MTEAATLPSSGTDSLSAKRRGGGHFAAIALFAGAGLLLCSVTNVLARQLDGPPTALLWLGVLIIVLPIFYRLTSEAASPGERLALVCLLGLSLYGVKLFRDAPLFTFSDEPVHAFNATQIVNHHHLFHFNPILTATPNYPGLEGATSALMTLTGMSPYGAGIIIVGAARLLLVAALFLLFSKITGSARIAGLGVAVYAGNFNFLFWSAQFSYESLALPIFVFVLMALAERNKSRPDWGRDWALPIVLGIGAIVITHHLTSYAVVGFLTFLALVYRYNQKDWKWPNPWPFAALAVALAAAWLVLVASSTVDYLGPVLTRALDAIFSTASGDEPARGLFQGKGAEIPSTPTVARGVAFLAVLLLTAALPFGLRNAWRRYRPDPFALLFMVSALGFFGTLALRLAPDAWETGNRASGFFFIGLAFVVACVGLERWRLRGREWLARLAVTGALGVIVVGGAIAGWPWDLQLSSPLRASAEGGTIVSSELAAAEWAEDNFSRGEKFATSTSSARLLLAPSERIAYAGKSPAIQEILTEPALSDWELPLLKDLGVRYIIIDRREVGSDSLRGYFFTDRRELAAERVLPRGAVEKFKEIPGAARVYSGGDISVYDLEARR